MAVVVPAFTSCHECAGKGQTIGTDGYTRACMTCWMRAFVDHPAPDDVTTALTEWRDARQAIFDAASNVTPDMWARLANAEHALMRQARNLKS